MIKNIYFLTIIVFCIVGCDKEVHLTNPKIFSNPSSPSLFDTIVQEMIIDLVIDGENTIADSYNWSILDSDNQIIEPLRMDGNKMIWVPCTEGIYTVKCQINAENKSITDIERYTIKYNQNIMHNKLSGKWKVVGSIKNEYEWIATFDIIGGYYVNGYLDEVVKGDVLSPYGKITDCDFNKSTITFNNWLGGFLFDGAMNLETRFPNGGLINMEFSNDFSILVFDVTLTDHSIEDKDKRDYVVNFILTKEED